jgi:hypothetical protein
MNNQSIPEWNEDRAIAALEENKQVMIPGLREQAKGQKVYVEHEFSKLRGVILGNPESMYLPDPFHPSGTRAFGRCPGKNSSGWPTIVAGTFAMWIGNFGKVWRKASRRWLMPIARPEPM